MCLSWCVYFGTLLSLTLYHPQSGRWDQCCCGYLYICRGVHCRRLGPCLFGYVPVMGKPLGFLCLGTDDCSRFLPWCGEMGTFSRKSVSLCGVYTSVRLLSLTLVSSTICTLVAMLKAVLYLPWCSLSPSRALPFWLCSRNGSFYAGFFVLGRQTSRLLPWLWSDGYTFSSNCRNIYAFCPLESFPGLLVFLWWISVCSCSP